MLQNVVLGNREGSTIENKLLCCSAHVRPCTPMYALLRDIICGLLENSRVT